MHAYNSSTREAESGGSLCKSSLGYSLRLCLISYPWANKRSLCSLCMAIPHCFPAPSQDSGKAVFQGCVPSVYGPTALPAASPGPFPPCFISASHLRHTMTLNATPQHLQTQNPQTPFFPCVLFSLSRGGGHILLAHLLPGNSPTSPHQLVQQALRKYLLCAEP